METERSCLRACIRALRACADVGHLTRLSLLGTAGYYTWTSTAHADQLGLVRRIDELTPSGEGVTAVVKAINAKR